MSWIISFKLNRRLNVFLWTAPVLLWKAFDADDPEDAERGRHEDVGDVSHQDQAGGQTLVSDLKDFRRIEDQHQLQKDKHTITLQLNSST